ncbi:MAG: conjugal transfer protein TraC [Parcubacteria group bacterium RIFCSPLOWO2_01_FULL_48_18]|nr:MAG: conjugal transfer protein TraC [Parcubacteria group bacterium RIFCSPHIGHO2_02_FULL_48_10b]OHB22574.1 MAG: conjugal transfer protein TraC [Parcubacteria group bacterium RIFCSPLOWO2_01_FULL_48_18]
MGGKDIKDIISPPALEIESNFLKLGKKFVKSYFVFTYPRFLVSGWFSPIINMDKAMDIAIFVHPIETATALKKLRRKTAQVQAQLAEREEKGYVSDPALETAYQDIESLRQSLQQSTERLFNAGLYFTLYGDTLEEINAVESKIVSILEGQIVYTKPCLFQQYEGFVSTLPLGHDKILIHTPLNSGPISSFFPFVSSDLTSDKGILYGINRHNNSLVIFDRFSMENANQVLFAKSGSGKSYTTKLEILRYLMLGTDILIIDPENEYQNLSDTVGGAFFKISLTSDYHINPFDIPKIPKGEDPGDVLRSHIVNLSGLLKLMLGGVTPEEDAVLDRAITETYASRDITPDADFSGKTPPLMQDLQTVLENMEGAKDVAAKLEKYTKGTYSTFINQPTNIDVKNRLIVFSLRDLEDQLRPMAMYIVLNFIWGLIRAELKRRLLIIDEAWWMMKSEDSASFLFGLAKRARKYYMGVSTITQDVEDFLKSPYGKPIITNSAIQILLKQAPSSIDAVAKTFNLTEAEKQLLLESGVGEGLFFAGLKHAAIKVIASYTEDQIVTTNPQQIMEQQKLSEQIEKMKEKTN